MTMSTFERERCQRSLFTTPNKYQYQLNVNNSVIKACREDRFPGRYRPESDKERIAFEISIWNFFRKLYRRYDPQLWKEIPPLPVDCHISEKLFGWRYEQFEIFVNKLDIPKTVALFRKEKIEVNKVNVKIEI